MKFQPAQRDSLPTLKCHGATYEPGKLPLRSGAKLERARKEKVLYTDSTLMPLQPYDGFLPPRNAGWSIPPTPSQSPGSPRREINTLELAPESFLSPPLTHWALAPAAHLQRAHRVTDGEGSLRGARSRRVSTATGRGCGDPGL